MCKLYMTYNGLFKDITDYCNNITLTSNADTLGDEFTFDSLININEGNQIGLENTDNNLVYVGVIVKSTKKKFTNSYTAIDLGWYLNKSKITMQFNNVNASTAIERLCIANNIRYDIAPMTTNINKIYKAEEISSAMNDILDQVNKETGKEYIKEMDITTFKVFEATQLKIIPSIVIGKEVTLDSSIEDMKNKCVIQSSDENSTTIYAVAEDTNSQGIYGLLQDYETIDDKDQSQAQNIAKNNLKKYNKITKNLSFTVLNTNDNDDLIKANRYIKITLTDFGIDDWIKIKSAKHTWKNNNHQIDLEFDI